MATYNKKLSETSLRLGEARFCYAHVFSPRKNDDGSDDKYGVQVLIPKSDTQAKAFIDAAVEAAKQAGVSKCWSGKLPPASKLALPLRDGDEEYPDDSTYTQRWNPQLECIRLILSLWRLRTLSLRGGATTQSRRETPALSSLFLQRAGAMMTRPAASTP